MDKTHSFSKALIKWIAAGMATLATLALLAAAFAYQQIRQLNDELPDINVLRHVQHQMPLSIYSQDGKLIAEFGDQKTIPVSISDTPPQLINAFLAAEDDSFYTHPGIDIKGLLRAAFQFLKTGKKRQGGSTITMQVTRNFFLSREKTFKRKIKEIILALKIEREFSKEEILELYLNKIYLGQHAYGVGAAAQIYYGKRLEQLTLAEIAMLAGLPKAPSDYNPITDPDKAFERRNYVLSRMLELGFITPAEYEAAAKTPANTKLHVVSRGLYAPYIAEMVRQEIFNRYGDDAYTQGLKVYTTIDSKLQNLATRATQTTLHEYDERHGFRKTSLENGKTDADLAKLKPMGDTFPALVTHVGNNHLLAHFPDHTQIKIPVKNLRWARVSIDSGATDSATSDTGPTITPKTIIRVRKRANGGWALTQIPKVEGALVSLNPSNGAILALTGGFDFHHSKFNRATQSKRQPGSGFKPVIYAAALENGFSPTSVISDGPLVLPGASRNSVWRPENYGNKFHGATTMRTALTYSRNLVSIRLLISIGLKKAIEAGQRFGFSKEQLPHSYSLALGSGYATPVDMARMYAVFANGGFIVTPYFLDRIEDSEGKILYQAQPSKACPTCEDVLPQPADRAPRIISPYVNYTMNSMLRDVVRKGTATAARVLGRRDLAGKTGTTNDERDAWFNGFVPSLVTTTWVGFDSMQPLGGGESGGHTALPMWIRFMRDALRGVPESKLEAPKGMVKAYVSAKSGMRIPEQSGEGEWEFFDAEAMPKKQAAKPKKPAASNAVKQDAVKQQKTIESLF